MENSRNSAFKTNRRSGERLQASLALENVPKIDSLADGKLVISHSLSKLRSNCARATIGGWRGGACPTA
jgi:hypothetical protein